MYRRRGQKPHWPRLRPAAEHSRAERHGDGTGLFLWSRSDAPIRVAWRERGSTEGGRERGKAQLVIIIVANQAAQFRPVAARWSYSLRPLALFTGRL